MDGATSSDDASHLAFFSSAGRVGAAVPVSAGAVPFCTCERHLQAGMGLEHHIEPRQQAAGTSQVSKKHQAAAAA